MFFVHCAVYRALIPSINYDLPSSRYPTIYRENYSSRYPTVYRSRMILQTDLTAIHMQRKSNKHTNTQTYIHYTYPGIKYNNLNKKTTFFSLTSISDNLVRIYKVTNKGCDFYDDLTHFNFNA